MGEHRAVIILSGGLDSTTCMGFAQRDGYELYPITFDYGQRHAIEIENAKKVAAYYRTSDRHKIINLHFLKEFGGSAITDESIDVPNVVDQEETNTAKAREASNASESSIPVTYVPGRNLLFLSIATSYAEAMQAEAIFIGVNALDYSGYPDCRPEFIHKVEDVIAYATKIGVEGKPIRIETPLLDLSKADIVREGTKMHVPYHLTTSCYNGREEACGVCDSCRLRLKGFADAGLADPIPYMNRPI